MHLSSPQNFHILLMVQKSSEILHQLRLVVYPIIHRVSCHIPGGCLDFWTINSSFWQMILWLLLEPFFAYFSGALDVKRVSLGKHTPIAGLPNAYLDDRMTSPSQVAHVTMRSRWGHHDSTPLIHPVITVFTKTGAPKKRSRICFVKRNARVYVFRDCLGRRMIQKQWVTFLHVLWLWRRYLGMKSETIDFLGVQKGEVGNRSIWAVLIPKFRLQRVAITRQGWWEINLICDHQNLLGGGFKCFLFSSLPVEMIQFD